MRELSIAVAMCTFDGERYVGEQLASIARQSRLPDSLLVVDDRSRDRTVEVVRDFASTAPFPVRVEINESNLGYRRNFERAIAGSEGDIVALADQDDYWDPRKLATLEAAFHSRPGVALAFSDAELVGPALEPLGTRLWETLDFDRKRQARVAAGRGLEVLLRRNVVTGATLAFRAAYRDLLLPFPPGAHHDAWVGLVLAAVSEVVPVPEPLVSYRQHGGNQIGAAKRSIGRRLAEARALQRDSLREQAFLVGALRERLRARERATPETDGLLRAALSHLEARIEMPAARARRIPVVCRQLANGGYARCANGVTSAIRDLVI